MTDNRFENRDGDRNVGQGDGSTGRPEKVKQKLRWLREHPEVTWSGTGIYAVSLIVAAGVAVASWYFWPEESSPPVQKNSISITGDKGTAVIGDHTVVNNSYGISQERFEELRDMYSVTNSALAGFFRILEEQQVQPGDLDAKLREIAAHYKELLRNWESVQSADPQVVKLKAEAKQAIDKGRYDEAEELLNNIADQYSIVAAEAKADNARLQRVQLRHAKAAEYWQKAAALLPEEQKKDRAYYLNEAGYDLHRLSRSTEAQPLYEQSLAICREIGDKAGEGMTLNNISQIYDARGDYPTALTYLEQSLAIQREIGDKAGEGVTLNNIGQIYDARGDYPTALTYLEQSLAIQREIGNRYGAGVTLNNIGQIYHARGDIATALKYLEQSLVIRQEIGDKAGEGATLSNIGAIHHAKGDYDTALKYLEQSFVIRQEIGDKAGEDNSLNNIGGIYDAQGDKAKALQYYEQSLAIQREIGNRYGEGVTLNNISQIYKARGDYVTALKYLEQSLVITQEIGDRAGEAVTSWNIGWFYKKQGDLAKAEQYISRAVQLAEEIGHPKLEEWRKALAELRAAIKGR